MSLSGSSAIGAESDASRQRRARYLAYVIGAFGLSLSAQVYFLVPLRARELGAGIDVIGLILGIGTLAAAASSVTAGGVIDRLGPKRAFLIGAWGTFAASLALALVDGFWWFIAIQPLHGVLRNLGWIASQTYITSFAADEERARLTGWFSLYSNIGMMLGPLLVGIAATVVGFRWALLVPAIYSLLFVLIASPLPPGRAGSATYRSASDRFDSGMGPALGLLANRGIQVALLLTFSRLWTSQIFSAFLPLFMVENGITPSSAGTVMATSGFVAALVAPTAGKWARRFSPQAAASLGLGCNAVGLILAPHLATLPLIFIVPILMGIGTGLSLPLLITIVTSVVPIQQRGTALGLRAFVNQVAATAAPVTIGPLMTFLGLTLGFMVGGGVAGMLVIAAFARHRSNGRQSESEVAETK